MLMGLSNCITNPPEEGGKENPDENPYVGVVAKTKNPDCPKGHNIPAVVADEYCEVCPERRTIKYFFKHNGKEYNKNG